jgi:hypothetical protein
LANPRGQPFASLSRFKNLSSRSLPSLKVRPKQQTQHQQHQLKKSSKKLSKRRRHNRMTESDEENLLSSASIQMVKFNLANETSKTHNKKKLTRLNSIDRGSSLSCSSIASSSSSQLDLLEANRASTKKHRRSNTRSISTLKSGNSATKGGAKTVRKNSKYLKQSITNDEESLSHRTNNSVVTLSETEMFGNAVENAGSHKMAGIVNPKPKLTFIYFFKAQLPNGIDNIRRHLDLNIDNVPLHVSLFTDSTKPCINEMIQIMKDYGEIVCTLGSSHSVENNLIFATSNVA